MLPLSGLVLVLVQTLRTSLNLAGFVPEKKLALPKQELLFRNFMKNKIRRGWGGQPYVQVPASDRHDGPEKNVLHTPARASDLI